MTANGSNRRKRNAFGGEAFIMIPHSLYKNSRYRRLNINARRFLDFLIDEHLNHRGKYNGRLQATYSQLAGFGIGRRLIAPAIREACRSGLVKITRPGGRHLAARYELTWLPSPFSAVHQPHPEAITGEPA